jgi:endonuclease/exonuclease/phosphatase (EEP) superfamily protein YafD
VTREQQLLRADAASISRSAGECPPALSAELKPGLQQMVLPQTFSLLLWNVQKGKQLAWLAQLDTLAIDKDLLLLQEVALRPGVSEYLQNQNSFWRFHSAFRYLGTETGVLTAATTPPLFSCGLRAQEPVIGIPKTILITAYALEGSLHPLVVANLHAINLTTGIEAYRAQFTNLAKTLQKSKGPLIVAGDFNSWTKERKAVLDALQQELSLTPVTLSEHNRTTFWGMAVDHIYYRGLRLEMGKSLPTETSDHNPLTAEFSLLHAPEKAP